MAYVQPTGRWNREEGKFESFEDQGGEVLRSYSDGQETVKGVVYQVLVPHSLAGLAEAYGIPVATHVKVGALRRLKEAIRTHETSQTQPGVLPAVRGLEAAAARQSLGEEIRERRKELGVSRKMFAASVRRYADAMPRGNWHHGWSMSTAQAWERGVSAPRQIEPIIKALNPPPEQEARWRRWWLTCRVGISSEERAAEMAKLEQT